MASNDGYVVVGVDEDISRNATLKGGEERRKEKKDRSFVAFSFVSFFFFFMMTIQSYSGEEM